MDLRNEVLLLGGATGCLGAAIAECVLAAGGRVAAAVRKPWQVARVVERLGKDRVLAGVVGTDDAEAAAGLVKGAQDALGPITAFVGAAGAWQAAAAGREPGGDLAELLAANLHANATLARAVLPALRRRQRGTLVFLGASPTAMSAGSAAFAASKAALQEYTVALARDLRGTGVRAVAALIGPAAVATDTARARLVGELVALAFASASAVATASGEPLVPLSG
ncbi:MAG: SDR family NAD(P)-dependent oxidoreductase [Planctomycetota bacterium]